MLLVSKVSPNCTLLYPLAPAFCSLLLLFLLGVSIITKNCIELLFVICCCSYFIKLFLDKKYALPYRVLDAVVDHFMRFLEDSRIMPVIWHQSLLAFVQRLIFLGHCFFFSVNFTFP